MTSRSVALGTVVAVGLLACVLPALSVDLGWPGAALRVVVALPLVLLLPGWALSRALFPRLTWGAATGGGAAIERFALTLGLSMSVVVLGALLLNVLPGGLNAVSWVVFLGAVTMLAEAVVCGRRSGAGRRARVRGVSAIRLPSRPRLNFVQLGALVAAASVAVGALWLARTSEIDKPTPSFSQLWLVPQDVTDGPTASSHVAQLGVHSYEDGAQRFRLVLSDDGVVVDTWTFLLPSGDEWTQQVPVRKGTTEAVLYRALDPQPYRRVTLRSS